MKARAWAFAASVTLAACGGGSSEMSATSSGGTGNPGAGGIGTNSAPDAGTSTGTFLVSITGLATSPENLVVPPGATVAVQTDGTERSVTSQASAGAYTPGSVAGVSFDTGVFAGATSPPASAPVGTAPCYRRVHFAMMADAAASSSPSGCRQPGGAVPSTPAPATPPSNMPSMPTY